VYIRAVEISIDFSITASRYFTCRLAMLLNNFMLVDKRRSTVRITGNKTVVAETKRRIKQILDRHRKTSVEDPRHVRDTKGTAAYLTVMGSEESVRYPLHWNKEDADETRRIRLSPQSILFQQIVKLARKTWESDKVGIGFDGAGLAHSKMVVKHVYACKNVALFRRYDAMRKNLCKDASVNPYAPVNGLHGEQEIATRMHITGTEIKLEIRGNAQRVARPAQTRLQNSRVTGPKFTIFSDVEGSLVVLMCASTLLFFHLFVDCERTTHHSPLCTSITHSLSLPA